MALPNWQEVEDQLYTFTVEALGQFAAKRPDTICSFCAYAVDLPFYPFYPRYFDTPANAVKGAQRTGQHAIER